MSAASIAAEVEGVGGQPANSFLKTSRLRTWITGTMPCGLVRPSETYLVQMVSSVCGGN